MYQKCTPIFDVYLANSRFDKFQSVGASRIHTSLDRDDGKSNSLRNHMRAERRSKK